MLFYDEQQDLVTEKSALWADQLEGLLNFMYF